MKKILIIISLMFVLGANAQIKFNGSKARQNTSQDAQDLKLAQQYYRSGEYEKALTLFKALFEKNTANSYYYTQYLNTLLAIKDLDNAKTLIENQIKKNKKNPSYYVDLGNIYKLQDKDDIAATYFEKAIKNIGDNEGIARQVASTFTKVEEYEFALSTYEMIKKNKKREDLFLYEMANVYSKKGDFDNTVRYYLKYAKFFPKNIQIVKNYFQRNFKEDKQFEILQKQLYSNIQNQPDEKMYPEMLVWLFTQKKDFENAIIQVKALDKRFNEDGSRVFKLGQSAIIEEQYDAAETAFRYVIEKGQSTYYLASRSELLRTQKLKVLNDPTFTQEDIAQLENDYQSFLNDIGKIADVAPTMIDFAELYALHIYDLEKAQNLCQQVIDMPTVNPKLKSKAKINMGDYLLMDDNVWDAVLLYSQVDKAMKDDILGEEARFRNARLSYFIGDFEWAQTQLGALKASTTELISNDAIDLSVFITDHLGLDTTATTMQMFARADLLLMQNRTDDALLVLDSIDNIYPGHALADDILMRRGDIARKDRDYTSAINFYKQIESNFSDDILADDAIFNLGELYQFFMDEPQTAMEYYQALILDHTGSLHTVEARKRFRALRGDILN